MTRQDVKNFVHENLKYKNKGEQLHSDDNTFLYIPSLYLQILYKIYDEPLQTTPESDEP